MARATKCPVSGGKGKVLDPVRGKVRCYGCGGKGWVEVGDK